jgi:ribosomal protein L2, bacterial/organellar
MVLKSHNPTTPSRRSLVIVDRTSLWNGPPVKALTEGKTKKGGRNNFGRITARRIGGGHKKKYRIIDFKRKKFDVSAIVERLEYDPNRTAFIALIKYDDGELSYIIAPQRLKTGDKVVSGPNAPIKPGNALPLSSIPVGTIVHNIEMKLGKGAQIARSAGTYAQLVGQDSGYALLNCRLVNKEWSGLSVWASVGACL